MPALLSPKKPLVKCPKWPTMQWLAKPVVRRLDALVANLQSKGWPSGRNEVTGTLVLAQEAPSAVALWEVIRPYKEKFAPPNRRRAPGAIPVTLLLPSPISLRVDGFVEIARQLDSAYRHDIIGALIMSAPDDAEWLEAAYGRYREAEAGHAVVPGQARGRVLRRVTPEPGPRPR